PIREAGEAARAGGVDDGRWCVEDLVDPLDGRERLLDGVKGAQEVAEWAVEERDRGDDREELAGGQRALDDAKAAVPDGADDPEGRHNLQQGPGELVDAMVAHGQPQTAVVEPVEARLLEILSHERLDDLAAGEGLHQHHRELPAHLLGAAVDLVELAPERPVDQRAPPKHPRHEERERPVAPEHDGPARHTPAASPGPAPTP